jgi:choline dehydrogenase-like flavoprotein
VVVGTGPGGAAVARRLADVGWAVVAVEAGPGGPRPASVAGLDLVAASGEDSRLWSDLRVRDRTGGPLRPYPQGRGLGGGSMVNGMLLTPGDRVDYEHWRTVHRCREWGAEAMAPWLERAAQDYPTVAPEVGPVAEALGLAAAEDGLPVGGTSLEPDRLGVLAARLAARDGRRWSSADAGLGGDGPPAGTDERDGIAVRAVTGRELTVVSGVPVDRVVTGADGRVRGVMLASGHPIDCPLVVICAGALATPGLLRRSSLTDRPVGRVLRDHPSFAFTLVLRPEAVAADPRFGSPVRAVTRLVRWSSGPDHPGDLQAIALDRVDPGGPGSRPLAGVAVGLMAASSVGSVGPAGADPGSGSVDATGPDVVTAILDTASDRARLREGVRRVARWLRSDPFDPLVEAVHLDEIGTELAVLDGMADAELDRLLGSRPGPYVHPAGTCPLGPADEPGAVVDCETGRFGALHGRRGVRLADASVLPNLVRGGLQLPVAAVAHRIADDILSAR